MELFLFEGLRVFNIGILNYGLWEEYNKNSFIFKNVKFIL